MSANRAPISPQEAKLILDSLRGRKSLAALRRELVRRGKPVSMTVLKRWKANGFARKRDNQKPAWVREAEGAVESVGLPLDVARDLEARLASLSDGALVHGQIRGLFIHASMIVHQAVTMVPELDPRGAALLFGVAAKMTLAGLELMRQSRELAERSMRERLALMGRSP
jgi:hypothetical protein